LLGSALACALGKFEQVDALKLEVSDVAGECLTGLSK